jgi:hypothetical protein
MNQSVDEPQLPHDRWRENERMKVRLPHALVEKFDGEGQGRLHRDQRVEVTVPILVEVDVHGHIGLTPGSGLDAKAKAVAVSRVSTIGREYAHVAAKSSHGWAPA